MATTTILKPDGKTYVVNQTNGLYHVPYWDIPGEYHEDWQTNDSELHRTVECRWSDVNNFLLDMLGWAQNTSGYLNRFLPDAHPAAPSFFCVSAKMIALQGKAIINPIDGFFDLWWITSPAQIDQETQTLAHPEAPPPPGFVRWALTYRKPDYAVLQDSDVSTELERFVQKRYSYAVEHLPLAGTFLKFADSGAPYGTDQFPLRLPSKSLIYTWHSVPCDPVTGLLPTALETNIETCAGAVNQYLFEGRYPPETLLCEAPETFREQLATGDFAYRIAYKLIHRKTGWNTKYRRETVVGGVTKPAGFYKVVNADGTGLPPYPLADFMSLFRLS